MLVNFAAAVDPWLFNVVIPVAFVRFNVPAPVIVAVTVSIELRVGLYVDVPEIAAVKVSVPLPPASVSEDCSV